MQLGQLLLLLPNIGHLFHCATAAKRPQFARMKVSQKAQKGSLHVTHIRHFRYKTVMACTGIRRGVFYVPCKNNKNRPKKKTTCGWKIKMLHRKSSKCAVVVGKKCTRLFLFTFIIVIVVNDEVEQVEKAKMQKLY